jgi:hypothetical protein
MDKQTTISINDCMYTGMHSAAVIRSRCALALKQIVWASIENIIENSEFGLGEMESIY